MTTITQDMTLESPLRGDKPYCYEFDESHNPAALQTGVGRAYGWGFGLIFDGSGRGSREEGELR